MQSVAYKSLNYLGFFFIVHKPVQIKKISYFQLEESPTTASRTLYINRNLLQM